MEIIFGIFITARYIYVQTFLCYVSYTFAMNEFEFLQDILKYRIERYLKWATDWRDFPIPYDSKDPRMLAKNFNWVSDIAGYYAHDPPFAAQVDVVSISPFGVVKIERMTCETASKLHDRRTDLQMFGGCNSVQQYLVRWGGSKITQRLLQTGIAEDLESFSIAFLKAVGIDPLSGLEVIPLYRKSIIDRQIKRKLIDRRLPKLRVDVTFPLRISIPGGMAGRFIEVVR